MADQQTHYRSAFFKTSDGLNLNYRVYGEDITDGPIMIALPGLTRNIRDLDPMAAALGRSYRVYTLNLRGRDTSDHDPEWSNYRTPVYIRDIHEFWQHLGVPPVVLLGSSLGALLAMLMVEDHPDMLRAVVYNDLGATIEAQGMGRIFGYAGKLADEPTLEGVVATLKDHIGNQFEGLTDAEWERMATSMYEFRNGVWHHRYDDNLGRALAENPETFRDLWACHARAAEMNLPILAIRGVLSDVTARETLDRMKESAPAMVAVDIPGRGHCPILDEPESLEALHAFMASLAPAPAPAA